MKDITILVVDDDEEIAELVEIYLTNDGYHVIKAYDGQECLKTLEENKQIKLIILDIMMPNIDGLEVCRKIRKTSNIPIIMLSAKAADMDKIIGFGTGADDYMTKPFNPLELMARVKSQLKRYTNLNVGMENSQNDDVLEIQDLVINRKAHKVHKNGAEVNLTPIEFEILYLLASNKGRVFGTDEIFERVWNEKVYEVNNTVMVHIRRLREKIEDNPRSPQILKTVWGVGYKVED
ncbi:MAG TPA: DNA-binding response regulator [Lachnospiraceae bacterium]|nr:DNA-binding response regulator [Lachnospiraceae bacterium]HIS61689.1 response regulator transcription factor [Candidatus Scybalomonas excrementigallinarum]